MNASTMSIAWYPKHADPAVASTRLRVLSPMSVLAARGHATSLYVPQEPPAKVIVFGKRYGNADYETAQTLKEAGCKVVLDMCDNMFFNEGSSKRYAAEGVKLKRMLNLVDRVICSTPTLAEIIANEAGLGNMPIWVDDPYEPLNLPANHIPESSVMPALLWFGRDGADNAPNGIFDITAIANDLEVLHARYPFRLLVCSNNRERFDRYIAPLSLNSEFHLWNLETFPHIIAEAQGVILPFALNDFVRPKTHNRMSLVLGEGIPVAATGIPSYLDFEPFCYLDDWHRGLETILRSPAVARAKAAPARQWLEKHLNADKIADQWEAALAF